MPCPACLLCVIAGRHEGDGPATGQEDVAAKTAPKKKKPKNLKKRVRITFVGKKPKAPDTELDEAQQKESESESTEEKSEE